MSVFREFVEEQGLCLLDQLTVERVPKMLKLRRKAFLSYSRSAQLVLFYLAVKSLKGDIRSRGHLEDAVNCVSKISDRDFGNFALKSIKKFCCGGALMELGTGETIERILINEASYSESCRVGQPNFH